MNTIITSDDILGKDAIDPEGELLGVVTKLHINKNTKQIQGITIDQGLMKPDLFVGINNIKQFGIDSILLTRIPVEKFKGVVVITEDGKKVGIVKKIYKHKNSIKEIFVSQAGINVLGSQLRISYSDIKEMGDSIILKNNYKPLD
jgi:sporulation protein YlmC with PRC-barrel domain